MPQEAIKSKQKKIFKLLPKFKDFYLVGGTALAMQIKHRISVDFDMFSGQPITKKHLAFARQVFKGKKVEVMVNHSEQLSLLVDGVKIDFVSYPYPWLFKAKAHEGVKIVRIKEIAVMKAFTLDRRGTFKDYVDLFFIFKENYITLKELKQLAEKKYKKEFNMRNFLEQLIYLDDIREDRLEFLKKKVDKKQIEKYFVELIKNFSK